MSEEIWKDIKGYEGVYQVSNLCKVRSLQYNKQKILKIGYTNKGYGSINLCKNGKISHRNVHRLVAETFIPNPNKYFCVNHKDENPRNNNVDNLEWCTGLQNIRKYMSNHPELQSKKKHTPKYNRHMEKQV